MTQRNNADGFFQMMNDGNLPANQNPSCFKELEYLKWQMIKLYGVLIINRTLLFVDVDANIVIFTVLGVNGS